MTLRKLALLVSMFSFLNNQTHPDSGLALVYDIGGSSVGAGLVALRKNNSPEIFYTTRESMPFDKKNDPSQLLAAVKRGLKTVGTDIQTEGMQEYPGKDKSIDGIYCTFSSPWFISHTQTIEQSFETPKEVHKGYLDQLVEQAHTNFHDGPLKEYKQNITEELILLEKNIMQIKLNKYKTNKPVGRQARDIQLSIFFSAIPKQVKQDVQAAIASRFNTDHFHWHSFSLTAFSVLRNTFSHIELTDFLFLDVSGELTDVLLIRDDLLVESVSFPIGTNEFIRTLANHRNIQTEEAASQINAFVAGDLHKREEEKVKSAVQSAAHKWKDKFKQRTRNLFDEITLPNHLFFIAADNTGPIFEEILNQTSATQHALKNDTLENVRITEKMFSPYRKYAKKGTRKDVFLSLESIFANSVTAEKTAIPHLNE